MIASWNHVIDYSVAGGLLVLFLTWLDEKGIL